MNECEAHSCDRPADYWHPAPYCGAPFYFCADHCPWSEQDRLAVLTPIPNRTTYCR